MRQPLYIASVDSYSGKSVAALAIGLAMREAGHMPGYFKPLGTLPHEVAGVVTDEDAHFISERLNPGAPLDAICPILLNPQIVQQALRGEVGDLPDIIRRAYQRVSAGRDIMLVGGVGDLSRGSLLELSGPQVAALLDAKVILLARLSAEPMVEEVLLAQQLLRDRIGGVIFNFVGHDQQEALSGALGRHLRDCGMPVLGALPQDDLLGAITVRELAADLPAKPLCCEKAMDELIVHFVIGAMGVASAAKYFRQLADKAVITGGDRADIQLAALQTATKAIVLTGNIYPSGPIIARAQQLGVPLLLVPHDTLATVERIEGITGRMRVRADAKVERARALFDKHVDMARIMEIAEEGKRNNV